MTAAPGDFEALARSRLDGGIFDYFAGGADAQVTVGDNPSAWQRIRLRPRILRDVAHVDTSVTLCGTEMAAPIVVAPMAAHRLVHGEGECATARGAAQAGVGFTLSTLSSRTMEDVARAVPDAPRWFQLYVRGDMAHARALVERAEASGFTAIVVTADVPTLGLRRHEQIALDERVNLPHMPPAGDAYHQRVALTFDDLAEIVSWTDLPVLAKGVLRGDDARECLARGARGVIVSNHGGRQLDTTIDPPSALVDVASAVGRDGLVMVDGGIRLGTDVVKAIALGADAVMVGRPVIWGLAIDGAAGVRTVLTSLTDEFVRAMKLCGAATLDALAPDLIAP